MVTALLEKEPSKPPRNSHVLPAALISRFGIANSSHDSRKARVWVYRKDHHPKQIGVSKLFERDFYAYRLPNNVVDHSNESRMASKVEAPFNQLLRYLDSPLYLPEKEDASIVARYVACLFNRSHQRRIASRTSSRQRDALYEEVVRDEKALRQIAAAYSFRLAVPVSIEQVRSELKSRPVTEAERDAWFLAHLEQHEDYLFSAIKDRYLGILRAPSETPFVISDTGLISGRFNSSGFTIGEGLAKHDVHILLPISPRRCLCLGPDRFQERQLTSPQVGSINYDSIRLMHRQLYSSVQRADLTEGVNQYGGSVRYLQNAFIYPMPTVSALVELFSAQVMHEHFAFPLWKFRQVKSQVRRIRSES